MRFFKRSWRHKAWSALFSFLRLNRMGRLPAFRRLNRFGREVKVYKFAGDVPLVYSYVFVSIDDHYPLWVFGQLADERDVRLIASRDVLSPAYVPFHGDVYDECDEIPPIVR